MHQLLHSFSVKDSIFSVSKAKEATGRAVVAREFDTSHSYTLECSFGGSVPNMNENINEHINQQCFQHDSIDDEIPPNEKKDHETAGEIDSNNGQTGYHFNPSHYENIGKQLCKAIWKCCVILKKSYTIENLPA